jgi:hypothetical protein
MATVPMARERHQTMRLPAVVFAVTCALAGLVITAGPSYGCSSHSGGYSWVIECRTAEHGNAEGAGFSLSEQPGGATYTYFWAPVCPNASPTNPASASIDCRSAHTCADPQLISMSLYAMEVTNGAGNPARGRWTYLGSECRKPSDAGPTQQPRVLTWTDVLSAIREIGVPAASIRGPDFTLVNLKTTFYTEPTTIDRPLSIIGYNVDVHVTPASYTWHWGDGTTETTDTPGRPYPSTDVTHTYVHATPPRQPLQMSVDVTYSARYQVDGGAWQTVPEALTIPGDPRALPVKQASAVLVAQ